MPYVAMEHSLRPYLGRLSLAQAGGVLEVVLAALDRVHGQLTPEDVRVTGDGRVEVTGFGALGTPQTLTSLSVASAAYMAPEHPLGGEIGPWSDVYSVGCLAFALLTGHAPFGDDGSPVAVLLRQVNEPAPRLGNVDPRLSDWVERLLDKDPVSRPQSAAEAWAALEAILEALLGPSWRDDAALAPRRATGLLDATVPAAAGSPAAATPMTRRTAPPPAAPPNARGSRPRGDAQPVSRREHTRRGWALPAAFAGGVAAVAVAAGALAADEPAAPAPATVVHTSGLTVTLPAGWRVTAPGTPGGLPGVRDPLTARGPHGATLVIGRADRTAFNRTLLPDGLRAAAAGRAAALRSGGQALRYDGLSVAGRTGSVYSIATAQGVAVLACFAEPGPCAGIASTLRGETLPLGPDRRFQGHAARILDWLEKRERILAARIDGADTRATRVAATKRLWWAYLKTAKALRQVDVHPADRELRGRLAEALRLAGCAYGRAANGRDATRERAIVLAQQAIAADAIERLAYELPGGAATFTRLPDLS